MAFVTDTEISDLPTFNPLQLIAADGLITIGLVAALKLTGMGWGMALFAGWIGGALITIGLFFALAHFWLLKEEDAPRWHPYVDTNKDVRPRPASLHATKEMWREDLEEERARWAAHAKALRIERARRSASTAYHVAMWDADLRADSMQYSA